MITNHQSDPGYAWREDVKLSEAIELLEEKRDKAASQRIYHEKLALEYSTEESGYAKSIATLHDAFTTILLPASKLTTESPKKNGMWVKPVDLSWLNLVRSAIRQIDNFVTQNDITEAVGMDDEAKEKYYQTLSGTLATYRKEHYLVGVQVYTRTAHGKAISQYFTGIPEFFENPETKEIKYLYAAKLRQKVKEMGLFLSEAEATAQL